MLMKISDLCLSDEEIKMLAVVASNEPVSATLINDEAMIANLIEKGYVEKVHQEFQNIDRYRLTNEGHRCHRLSKTLF